MTTITHGELDKTDIKRQTLMPLLHIVPVNFNIEQKTISYSFQLYFMDLVDFNKEDLRDQAQPFWGTDNHIDVFNNMTIAAQLFMDLINRGPAKDQSIDIQVPNSGAFFSNRFENKLAGVELGLTLTFPNTSITDGIC